MQQQKRVLIVGAGWDQAPIIQEARRQGHYVIAVDGNPKAYGLQFADKALTVSTRDKDGVLAVAKAERIDAITYMITESPLRAIRYVADMLGLPAPSHKSVAATVSKVRMREIFRDAGVPNLRFGRASTTEEALLLAEEMGLPLVMKPADLGGQIGLFQIADLSDVPRCFAIAKQASVGGNVILEELMEGPEVNVVAIVMDGEIQVLTVSDRIKHPTKAFGVVMRHLYPSDCSTETLMGVRDICQQAVTAMEVKNGIIFPQFILTPEGPRIAEIGERIPGGVMKELFEFATGYDLVKLQLDIALAAPLQQLESYQTYPTYPAVTVKFLTADPGPLKPGQVSEMQGRNAALTLDCIVNAQFYNDPTKPQEIRPLREARDRFFQIIAVGSTREQVITCSDRATEKLDFFGFEGYSLKNERGAER